MNTPRTKPIKRYSAAADRSPHSHVKKHYFSGMDEPFALTLGHIVSQWAHLEERMIAILSQLLGDVGDMTARQIFRSVNSTQARINILRTLLEASPINRDKNSAFDEIIAEFASLTKERNNYAHGLWYFADDGVTSRSDPSSAQSARPSHSTPVSLIQAMRVLERIKKLMARIDGHIVGFQMRQSALLAKSLPPSTPTAKPTRRAR